MISSVAASTASSMLATSSLLAAIAPISVAPGCRTTAADGRRAPPGAIPGEDRSVIGVEKTSGSPAHPVATAPDARCTAAPPQAERFRRTGKAIPQGFRDRLGEGGGPEGKFGFLVGGPFSLAAPRRAPANPTHPSSAPAGRNTADRSRSTGGGFAKLRLFIVPWRGPSPRGAPNRRLAIRLGGFPTLPATTRPLAPGTEEPGAHHCSGLCKEAGDL